MSNRLKDTEILPFHTIVAGSLTSGTVAIQAAPQGLSGRAATVADAWAHFRLKKLKFRLHPTASHTAGLAAGYVGGVQDTLPSTVATIGDLLPSCVRGNGSLTMVPTEWVNVPRSDLAGPLPWYKSLAGAADPTEEQPGYLVLGSAGTTDPYILEIRGVFEFKTAVAAANTPSLVALRAKVREDRILLQKDLEKRRLLAALTPLTPMTM
jgi:hypothetical protein